MNILLSMMLTLAMQAGPPPPSVRVLSREAMSQVDEPAQTVARTAAEFAALWKKHAGDKPAPAVDFGSQMVVAVFLGTRSSAGYAADITGTRQADGALIVEWQERKPKRGEVSAQVLTSPAVLATVPKFAGTVKFEKVEP
jgi:hypothetical protein